MCSYKQGKFLANLLDESNCNKFNVPKDSFLSGNIAFIKPIKNQNLEIFFLILLLINRYMMHVNCLQYRYT